MEPHLPPPWPEGYTPPRDSLSPTRRPVLGIILLGLGLSIIAWAWWPFTQQRQFIAHAARAQGRVVRLVRVPGKNFPEAPVFTFADAAGKTWQVQGATNDSTGTFRVGDPVEALYPPEDPAQAKINSFGHLWWDVIVLPCVGAVFAGAGWLTLRNRPLTIKIPVKEDGWVARALLRLYPRK